MSARALARPLRQLHWGWYVGGAAVLVGGVTGVAIASRNRGTSSSGPRADMAPEQIGLERRGPTCDLQFYGESDLPFLRFVANVSLAVTRQWPPPPHRVEEVMVEAMGLAFPNCPWPPSDPQWRLHGHELGQAVNWTSFMHRAESIFLEIARGEWIDAPPPEPPLTA